MPEKQITWLNQPDAIVIRSLSLTFSFQGIFLFQLAMRGALVEFLRIVSERLKLSVATTHLSVYLLDRFMDAHHISDNQLRLTALTAILLAGIFLFFSFFFNSKNGWMWKVEKIPVRYIKVLSFLICDFFSKIWREGYECAKNSRAECICQQQI